MTQVKATTNVVEVTDENFQQVVIEGSKERPVVVDLWAAWCGPCRVIGPILEKIAEERKGAFLLAKINVDTESVGQALLQAVRSQGIPTIVAFRDGKAVDMFIGAYPEPAVNEFIDRLLPTPADLEAIINLPGSRRLLVWDLDARRKVHDAPFAGRGVFRAPRTRSDYVLWVTQPAEGRLRDAPEQAVSGE